MGSRMNRYEMETPELRKRTEKNVDLYSNNEMDSYNKIDLNSNVSVLKTDVRDIDVNKIREMLDKKYRDNVPKRKSIDIDFDEDYYDEKKQNINTKEYDINEILAKAKTEQSVDYLQERLRKINNTNNNILENLNLNTKKSKISRNDEEIELMSLINTITELEIQNQEKAYRKDANLLGLNFTEEIKLDNVDENEKILENSFYTGNLSVTDKDFEDFKDIQKDINSNSVLIKILVFLFILIIIAAAIFLVNKYFELGLF